MEYEPIDRPAPDRTPSPDGRPAERRGPVTRRGGGSSSGSGGGGAARRRLLIWIWPLVGALVIGVVGGVGVAAAINMPRVEAVTDYTPTLITELLDREGDLVATYARERRVLLDEVPEVVRQAVVSAEDQNFFQHGGIDAVGIARAVVRNMQSGRKAEGASTLTMQLARLLYLSPEKRWRRKIEEAFMAVELEKSLTKDQILTLYVNLVNLGHGRYGFEAASQYFFNKPAAELSAAEAATLAGIIQRPSDYSPYRKPEAVTNRRNYVLRRMLEDGHLSRAEYADAVAQPLLVVQQGPRDDFAPYFAEEVRQHLEREYGATRLYESGLQVHTTLDPAIQRAAERSLRQGLLRLDHRRGFRGEVLKLEAENLETEHLPSWTSRPPEPGRWYQGIVLDTNAREARVRIQDQTYPLTAEGIRWTGRSRPSDLLERGDVAWFRLEAPEGGGDGEGDEAARPLLRLEQEPQIEGVALVIESATGAVRAMVGGWDFDRSKFNRAVQAERQVGSAFKVFVYGAALEAGFTPADTVFDGPVALRGAGGPASYQPRNHSRRNYGIVTLRRALEFSFNIPAVKLQAMVGTDRTIEFARRMGITTELPPYPSLALGSAELKPIELASAFAAIANQGIWIEPWLVERVETRDGRLLEEHFPKTRTATSPQVAYLLAHMLEGVVDRGTGARLRNVPTAIAGKTGTTDDYSDAWFIGFTPRYTILTWVGYDVKRSLGRGMDGSSAAVPIWKQIVETGVEEGWIEKDEELTPPPGITFASIDYRSGLAGGGFPEAFVTGTEPVQRHTAQWSLITSLPWYQQRSFYLPKEGEIMPGQQAEGG